MLKKELNNKIILSYNIALMPNFLIHLSKMNFHNLL